MHPIGYAEALLEEHAGAVRVGDKDRAETVRTELARHARTLEDIPDELRQRITEAVGSKQRTAKAAPAPEKAVPPAAK